jgi:hypothetical protein
MGLFGKQKTHKIVDSYSYISVCDPREEKIETEELMPAISGGDR